MEDSSSTIKPFHAYESHRKTFCRVCDFLANFGLVSEQGSGRCGFLFLASITRIYATLAFASVAIFTILATIGPRQFGRSTMNTVRQELGLRLVRQVLASRYPGARIADAFGPITRADGKDVIQLHITLPSEEHVITNWVLVGEGAALEQQD